MEVIRSLCFFLGSFLSSIHQHYQRRVIFCRTLPGDSIFSFVFFGFGRLMGVTYRFSSLHFLKMFSMIALVLHFAAGFISASAEYIVS